MAWVKWKRSLASKKDGGLGIGSIFGLNIGLLFKWICRFLNNHSNLWVRVIQCIHGLEGSINVVPNSSLKRSTWGSILSSINSLKQKVIDHISLCSRKIGNGADSRFRDDIWCGEQSLKVMFPHAFVRSLVDSHILDTDNEATRWNRNIPIKVNVFLWRLKLNKLSSRVNLDRRGIEVGLILCPSCLDDFETVNHSFFNCGMAKDLWTLLAKWWELDILVCGNIMEWYECMIGFAPFMLPPRFVCFLKGWGRG
ncbi:RNA-directed DNA polymerase, eukaryota, reverse transcriptase zinc-binding domain protein [Tanacetum coccineum]